jgi:hypothetical protein
MRKAIYLPISQWCSICAIGMSDGNGHIITLWIIYGNTRA